MGKDYSKYYTPSDVSAALVKLVDFKDNCTVVDICCGSGNLLKAAQKVNKTLLCYGVDIIDVSAQIGTFFKSDGRAYAIEYAGTFDYALANPPFGRKEPSKYTRRLFVKKYRSIVSNRIEIEMLLASLRILKDVGTLLIILPSTIVTGASTINVRKILANNHFVSTIVDLPLNAFAPERIKCSALVIQKTPNKTLPTTIYEMTTSFELCELRKVQSVDMLNGNWWDKMSKCTPKFTIQQGKLSSSMFCDSGVEVLHTGKRAENWQPTIRFAQLKDKTKSIVAEEGDIIISRIGASAGQKCIYHGPSRYISDCLLLIKSPEAELSKQIFSLDFIPLVSGLSTPYITACDIYYLYQITYQATGV